MFSKRSLLASLCLILLLSACGTSAQADAQVLATAQFQAALLTATYAVKPPTATPTPLPPSPTPIPPSPTPTIVRTPPALPAIFTTNLIDSLDTPHTYIQDTCQYLRLRWDPNNAAPGTVVMPIMYHSITGDDRTLANDYAIHSSELVRTLEHAHETGFETVTAAQLADFLYNNAKIPKRSLILIQDDRPPGALRDAFGPFLEKYGWTMTWAWPIADTDHRPPSPIANPKPGETFKTLWEQIEAYYATGLVDMQSHGYVHNIPISPDSSDDYIHHEMVDSRNALREHFYCKDHTTGQAIANCTSAEPIAYIWAGGGFSKRGAELGREAGYKLGFTTQPRGPIQFNWIPLGDENDPRRPMWVAEGPIGDPLMTLPRYWSTDAAYRLDEVANIGEEASKYAAANKAVELEYYDIVCKPTLGEIPGLK